MQSGGPFGESGFARSLAKTKKLLETNIKNIPKIISLFIQPSKNKNH